ncbi:MAG: antitoxin [Acidimicrobiia bacterium]|nr:antitoxin [Acidimicrobiia bacterium]
MGMFDKIKGAAGEHGDKIAEGVDKATDAIDEKTGGKFSDHLDKVDDMAQEHLGEDDA